MSIFVGAFVMMVVATAAMAIGVMNGRSPISGSCGGVKRLGLGTCEICGDDPNKCESEKEADKSVAGKNLGYEIMTPPRK